MHNSQFVNTWRVGSENELRCHRAQVIVIARTLFFIYWLVGVASVAISRGILSSCVLSAGVFDARVDTVSPTTVPAFGHWTLAGTRLKTGRIYFNKTFPCSSWHFRFFFNSEQDFIFSMVRSGRCFLVIGADWLQLLTSVEGLPSCGVQTVRNCFNRLSLSSKELY